MHEKGYNKALNFARFLVYKQVQVFLNVRYQCEIFFSNVKQVTKGTDEGPRQFDTQSAISGIGA